MVEGEAAMFPGPGVGHYNNILKQERRVGIIVDKTVLDVFFPLMWDSAIL